MTLFNPRLMIWTEHFIWSVDGVLIVPQTEIGDVTIELLELNRERILPIRRADVLINRHPPQNDPVQKQLI